MDSALEMSTPLADFPPHQRLCLYPSSGYHLLWAVMQLDCDLFVFSDKDPRFSSWVQIQADFEHHQRPLELVARGSDFVQFRSGNKTGLLVWEDNNQMLDRLHRANLKVHHFVGICDGCCEGGNYECIHDRPFVCRLMRVATEGMRYVTDHSSPLQGIYGHAGGMWHHYKFLDDMVLSIFPPTEYWGRRMRWPELHEHEVPDASFELQGVLIRPNEAPDCLTVLPKGRMEATQLEALIPFRTLARRSILAEYRVSILPNHVEPNPGWVDSVL